MAKKAEHLLQGITPQRAGLMFPGPPGPEELPAIVNLAEEMKEYFPDFERGGFQAALKEKAARQEVLVIHHHGNIAGCIAYSRETCEIDFLAVAAACRKHGVASRLLIAAMSEFPVGTELSVGTYRAGDPLGAGARRLYQKFGFQEGELLTAFGYPCQRLTVRVSETLRCF